MDDIKDLELKIRQLNSQLLDCEIVEMLLSYRKEVANGVFSGVQPDEAKYARKIVAFLREHLVK